MTGVLSTAEKAAYGQLDTFHKNSRGPGPSVHSRKTGCCNEVDKGGPFALEQPELFAAETRCVRSLR